MDRALFTGGEAYLTHNGITLQMHEDWTATPETADFDVKTSLQGTVGKGISGVMIKLSFTPIAFGGSLTALFAKLFPYQPGMKGKLIFPNVDLPAIIQTKAGKSITLHAAALTKMPEITFAPDKVFFGAAEITALIANGAASDDADALYTVANSAYVEPSMNPLDILFDLYSVQYGNGIADALDAIETDENGVKFTPTVQLKPRTIASRGAYNMMIEGVTAEAKFTPENIDEEDWAKLLRLQDTGFARGKLRGVLGDRFTVAGSAAGKALLTLPLAAADAAPLRFSSDSRVGEVTMQAHRRYTSTQAAGTTNADATVTVPSTAGLVAGQSVSGAGIPGGTTILSITNATTFELSANATATGTPTLTFTGLHALYTLGARA